MQRLANCFSIILATALLAQPSTANPIDAFRAYLPEFREEAGIPSFSVIVLKDGEIVLEEYLGARDDEGDYPTNADTSYFIASVTKSLTGTVFMRAADEGLVDLDARMADAEPGWADFCDWYQGSGIIFAGAELRDDDGEVVETIPPLDCAQPITIRHVLSHTINGELGTGFAYNPVAFARLGRVFPADGDGSLRDLFYRFALDPAEMENTAAGWRDRDRGYVLSDLAPPFSVNADGRYEKAPMPDDDFRGAAGVYATARDLAKFDRALDAGRLLSDETKQAMWTPMTGADGAPLPYSNGWYVQSYRGERLIWHSGWQPGAYSAMYLKVPERNVTLIALGNSEGIWWNNPITRAAIETSPLASRFLDLFVFNTDQ
ncbi:MAG: hypothetical protein Tsb0010_16070 [Parvularculaceae bacterium]